MRRLRYNVAVSLDGYIARTDGSYDWIVEDASIDFHALFAEFDVLLMGRKTYEVLQSQGDQGPFEGMRKVIVSRTMPPRVDGSVTIIDHDVKGSVEKMKRRAGKDIWLFGGGELLRHLLEAGIVDTIEVALMPVLLGGGIPLVAVGGSSVRLRRTHVESLDSGIVLLKYDVAARAA